MSEWPHISVLLAETVEALAPRDGQVFVDCTLGMGGHTEAILCAADCTVIGLDRDEDALAIAAARLARFGDRFVPVKAAFGDFTKVLDEQGVHGLHGVVADLGVSSLQLDTAERGFSFRHLGPLDMRMDSSSGPTAAEIVNIWELHDLQRCLSELGEERFAHRVAQAIVRGRPWEDTVSLADAISRAIPARTHGRIHPATRSFQAIRIAVNDELGQLERLLPAATERLRPDGRLAIISFHSLEDRIVKSFMARESGRGVPRDPYGSPIEPPRLSSRSRPIVSSPDDPNPRSRSARLRVAVRLP